jgi:hypothetical protein
MRGRQQLILPKLKIGSRGLRNRLRFLRTLAGVKFEALARVLLFGFRPKIRSAPFTGAVDFNCASEVFIYIVSRFHLA